ncbi:hypothetical protein [Saccharopolyspora shandongensis]|uniref:hypothetical protein n=1 Tax=Saccharopolyspora shandongensis TaxID=418495 RepID=UPI0033DCA5A2
MDRTSAARVAAITRWARTTDRAGATAAGTAGLLAKFEAEADPDGVMSPEQRRDAAIKLRRAHMIRLAARSAERRRANKGGTDAA